MLIDILLLIIVTHRTETQVGSTALGETDLKIVEQEIEKYEKVHSRVTRPKTLEDLSLAGHKPTNNSMLEDILLQYIVATALGMKINLDYIRKNGGSRKYK